MRRAAALVLAALALVAAPASAGPARPPDVPAVATGARTPPPPPEYLGDERDGMRFAYHPAARDRVRPLLGRATEIRTELSELFGRAVLQHVEVRVAAVAGEMARLVPPGDAPRGVIALAYPRQSLVVLCTASPLSLDPPDLEAALRHGLAHVALDDALGDAALPPWLDEGLAVDFSGESESQRAQALVSATLHRRLLGLRELEAITPDDPRAPLGHAEAADVARFLVSPDHRESFPSMLDRMRGGEPFDGALAASYGADLARLDATWREVAARRYGFVPVLGAAALLWSLVACAGWLRQRRRRAVEAPPASRRTRRAVAERRAAAAALRTSRVVADREVHGKDGVPKVVHGGRFHTLH